jgi:sugar O-acyltransferase (sialic acid O-acetyltransferase NeuD family)
MKYIVGTGGFAREVYMILEALNLKNDFGGFLEPDHIWEEKFKDTLIYGHKVLPQSSFQSKKDEAIIGIGDPKIREKVVHQLPDDTFYPSIIHPTAVISNYVKMGEGAIITAGTVVTVDIEIGRQCQLNLLTTIGHDCIIGDYFTTAPDVNISGICTFGDYIYFGTNSCVRQKITICDNVTIGMGGVVVKNITEPGVYIGNPVQKLVK